MKSPLTLSATFRSILVTLGVGILSVQVFAQNDPSSTRPSTKTDRPTTPEYKSPSTTSSEQMTDQQFVYKAALGGQKEIALSQLALEKSNNDEVKKFAQQMITDHSQVDKQLVQIAQTKGLSVPPTNAFQLALNSAMPSGVGGTAESPRGSEQRRADSSTEKDKPFGMAQIPQSELAAAKKLQDQSGAEFDKAYVTEMCKDHEQTISKFEQASRSATDPELKRFASDTLTKLREHNHMAEQLAQTVGAKQ